MTLGKISLLIVQLSLYIVVCAIIRGEISLELRKHFLPTLGTELVLNGTSLGDRTVVFPTLK